MIMPLANPTPADLRDELTDENFDVKPKLVINATGAWIDSSNRKLGLSSRFIGGTKGSHIVVQHNGLREAIGDHEFFFENDDGRIVLIFPLYDRVLIGTSDIATDNPEVVKDIVAKLEAWKATLPAKPAGDVFSAERTK